MATLSSNVTVQRSAQQLILSGLRKSGALRSGQNITAAELADCLQLLNDLLDSYSAERLMIYVEQRIVNNQNGVTLSLIANQASYKVGNANNNEDFLIPRPPRLSRASIIYPIGSPTVNEIPMDMYDDVQWQAVPNKNTTSILPQVCYTELTSDGADYVLTFWPIPTQANPVALYDWSALNQFPSLQAKFFFPPAYSRMLTFNFALDSFEFGADPSKLSWIVKMADRSRAVVQAINQTVKIAVCDPFIVGSGGVRGNIFAGAPSRNQSN